MDESEIGISCGVEAQDIGRFQQRDLQRRLSAIFQILSWAEKNDRFLSCFTFFVFSYADLLLFSPLDDDQCCCKILLLLAALAAAAAVISATRWLIILLSKSV